MVELLSGRWPTPIIELLPDLMVRHPAFYTLIDSSSIPSAAFELGGVVGSPLCFRLAPRLESRPSRSSAGL